MEIEQNAALAERRQTSGRKPIVDKLLCEIDCRRVTEAIVLTNNTTDPVWWSHRLSRATATQCFPCGRIKFLRPDGTTGSPAQGQVFHFLGENVDRFHEVFLEIGFIAVPRREARQ